METITGTVLLIVFAAFVGESINEFLFAPLIDWLFRRNSDDLSDGADAARQNIMRWWSALVGVGIAYEFGLDVFALLDVRAVHPMVGVILTGCLLGRGSNWIHEALNRFVLRNDEMMLAAADRLGIPAKGT